MGLQDFISNSTVLPKQFLKRNQSEQDRPSETIVGGKSDKSESKIKKWWYLGP